MNSQARPRHILLSIYQWLYRDFARPLIFRTDAQAAHERALHVLRYCDDHPLTINLLRLLHRAAFPVIPTQVGGLKLSSPLILAAGFVKGEGFATEAEALAAVQRSDNIIPGWHSLPALLGAVEFGSYTRYPRLGNPGTVIWRDAATRSTQNRVGLKNPGAKAAALFLAERAQSGLLPPNFGINIAVSPGVSDQMQEQAEAVDAFDAFLAQGVRPSWFTLNISCPNTDDDPGDHQTEARTRDLCRLVISRLESIPLWVKISPNLAVSQYQTLLRVFHEEGIRAVIATNTQPAPSPADPALMAGVGGGRLHSHALHAVQVLMQAKQEHGWSPDVIGCGGVQDAPSYQAFAAHGITAMQYWSALIYAGPLAAARILNEVSQNAPTVS
jgi:dihydroorotate dehydrogenase